MRTSIVVGKVAGIPIKIHLNWFITAVLVTWSLAGGFFPQSYPNLSRLSDWTLGTVTALLFFASVLFHELGHSLVSQSEGVPVQSITLFIFGGVAHIAHEPRTPEAEFRIVVAGPFTSMLLSGVFVLIGAIPFLGPELRGASFYLAEINLVLALFNLIPGFPLDGGRLLRSLLWKWKGSFTRATRWATNIGFGIAASFIVAGAALITTGSLFNGLWIGFIGCYLGIVARESYKQFIFDQSESGLSPRIWLQEGTIGKEISVHTKIPSHLSPVYVYQEIPEVIEPSSLSTGDSIEPAQE